VEVADASFEKDGRRIEFRKVRLTPAGHEPGAAAAVRIPERIGALAPRRRKRSKQTKRVPVAVPTDGTLEKALKAWRLSEARKHGIPAFRVLSDKSLHAIATTRPLTEAELLDVPGIGLKLVQRFGKQIFRVITTESA
jgi:superfamily II DNA helicase RecQ